MAGHNVKTQAQKIGRPRTAIRSEATASGTTFEGGPGYKRDAKSELFLLAVSDMQENKAYETRAQSNDRIRTLIREIAADGNWIKSFVSWLRKEAGMRSVPIVVAAEAVKARLEAGLTGHNREITAAAILRTDEPGEFLAYWLATFGRPIPSAVKRGIGDGVRRSFTERSVPRWAGKGERGSVSLADVLNLTRVRPQDGHQEALFKYVLDTSYGNPTDTTSLPMLARRSQLLSLEPEELLADVTAVGSTALADSGLTWENISGQVGKLSAQAWEALIPTLGYMALISNLRNMIAAGISDTAVDRVNARLADPAEVSRANLIPSRLLSAYRNAPLEFHLGLQRGMGQALEAIPALPGRTLLLVDGSGSMFAPLSQRGTLNRADAAAVFGAGLALRAENVDLFVYSNDSTKVTPGRGDGVLRYTEKIVEAMPSMGTNTAGTVTEHFDGHDRIIILTDEQSGGWYGYGDPFSSVPRSVHCFTWNLAGYERGHAPEGATRHTMGGLTKAQVDLIPLLERGLDTGWPWETQAA